MPATYLTLLTIAISALCLYIRSTKDITSVLAALTAIVCFIWGFAAAPWGVQLLIMTILLGLDKLYLADARRAS